MEEQKFSFSGSFQKSKEYLETELELLKLRAIAKASRIAGAMVLDATKLMLFLAVIFFLSLALGFFLGELMHSNALGFLTTGGIFLILLFVVKSFEPKLELKFMDLIISRFMQRWDDDGDLDIQEKVEETHLAAKKKAEETRVADFYEKDINQDEEKN